jgi:uncharacterized protein
MMGVAFKNLFFAGLFFGALILARNLLLPKLLRAMLGVPKRGAEAEGWRKQVERRYERQQTSIWMFAWFKLRLDPMFRELPTFLEQMPPIRTALDLGCGYGFAGTCLLTWNRELRLYGMDPNPGRVIAASEAFADRGEAFVGGAPDFELAQLPPRFDAVFILDVIHFLNDEQLDLTLRRVRGKLDDGAPLLMRVPMKPAGLGTIFWHIEKIGRFFSGEFSRYRNVQQITAALAKAGFNVKPESTSGGRDELHWFLAAASDVHTADVDSLQQRQVPGDDHVKAAVPELVPTTH